MTTTDLSRWEPSDDMPLILIDDEARNLFGVTGAGKTEPRIENWQPRDVAEVRELLQDAVTEMQKRQNVPAKPTTSQNVDTFASNAILAGALTGLVITANSTPELVGLPIVASLAATGIAAVVMLRTPPRVAR